jgi:predicted Zn-dependent protease
MHGRPVRRMRAGMMSIVAMVLVGYACATSGVNKGDLNLISYQEEWEFGRALERDIARQLPLVRDPASLTYINRMGQRLVAQTELAEAPWEFHIVADPSVNAFNVPGGHVYVHTGLIAATDNASELAGVMAHEIAHGVSRHGTEMLSRAQLANIGASLVLGPQPAWYAQLLAQIVGTGTFAKWGRDAERESDHLGVIFMHNAGYDPHGMVTMFQELLSRQKQSPGAVEAWFSSHPLTEERIQNVRADIEQLPPNPNLITNDAEFAAFRQRVARYR